MKFCHLMCLLVLCPAMASCQTVSGGQIGGSYTIGTLNNFGPPLYLGSTTSTLSFGLISPIFTSRSPMGTINTGLGGDLKRVDWVSGDNFAGSNCVPGATFRTYVSLPTSGTRYTIATCDSATTLHVTVNIGAFTGLSFILPQACIGQCQNSTAYDTTINPTGRNCITRLTDQTTFPSGVSAAGTIDGGDNGINGSVNETYLGAASTGGATYILHMNNTGICAQVINTGIPGISIIGPWGFSKVTDTRFYDFLSNKTSLRQNDIISDTAVTQTTLFDTFTAGPWGQPCPGIAPFTAKSGGIFDIKLDDTRFAWIVGPANQGSADWAFVWDKTLGCASVNFSANPGKWWDFCKSPSVCGPSTPASGTLNATTGCFGSGGASGHGIHNVQMSGDGKYLIASLNVAGGGTWSGGACAGSTIASQATIWQIGTSGNWWVTEALTMPAGTGAQLDNHPSYGVSKVVSNQYSGWNIRSLNNLSTFTLFNAGTLTDSHCSWPHPLNDDSYPIVCASDLSKHSDGTIGVGSCTSSVYCPNNLINQIFSYQPNVPGQAPKIFAHTFSCNQSTGGNIFDTCSDGGDAYFGAQESVGYATQKGNFFMWVSTHLHNLGLDNLGNPGAHMFVVRMQ